MAVVPPQYSRYWCSAAAREGRFVGNIAPAFRDAVSDNTGIFHVWCICVKPGQTERTFCLHESVIEHS
ncbi:hypothetical protein ABBQ32_000545 [Trebouxia sp. C0010 RCD-2024]